MVQAVSWVCFGVLGALSIGSGILGYFTFFKTYGKKAFLSYLLYIVVIDIIWFLTFGPWGVVSKLFT